MKDDILKEIVLEKGVTAEFSGGILRIKGPKGEVHRKLVVPKINLKIDSNRVIVSSIKGTKREKRIISSFASHIKNMISGVIENHVYKLKICSGHFPMNVSVSGDELIIKNFLGEAVPRKVKFISGVTVKIEGTEILVSSPNKEAAGQTAAKVEQLCRITNRDRRVFQDGCYIVTKSGKAVI